MIRVGVAGYGYWGPNLSRCLAATPGVEVAAIADERPERREGARRAHGSDTHLAATAARLLDWPLDAVAIATPAATHYHLVRAALEAGLHVLVTKPLATSTAEAEELAALATARGLVLLVDHTFVYTGACRKLRELVTGGDLGEPLSYDSVRISLGLVQPDVNVVWDLAPHDLAILDQLGVGEPHAVAAVAADPIGCGKPSAAHLFLTYPSGFAATVHVSWFSPVKVRRIMLAGSAKHVVYDDVEPTEKLKVYDATVRASAHTRLVDYRVGDIVSPKLDFREALAVECDHFAALIRGESEPGPFNAGVNVVRALEAAQRSIDAGGLTRALYP